MSVVGRVWAAALATSLLACIDVYRSEPIGPPGSRRPETLRVLVFGDFGYQSIPQRLTAGAMRRATRAPVRPRARARRQPLLLRPGPHPPRRRDVPLRGRRRDGRARREAARRSAVPRERGAARGAARARWRGAPIYLALGNHDVGLGGGRCARPVLGEVETMRRRACLAVARRTPTWTMPARHYVIDRGPVRFVVLDTNVTVRDYGGFTLQDEIAFVREATATCGAERHCFLVGHHPPAVLLGERAASPRRTRRASSSSSPPLGAGPARSSGATSTLSTSRWTASTCSSRQHRDGRLQGLHDSLARARAGPLRELGVGYAVLEADGRGYRIEFVDTSGAALHCCEAGTRAVPGRSRAIDVDGSRGASRRRVRKPRERPTERLHPAHVAIEVVRPAPLPGARGTRAARRRGRGRARRGG